MSKALVISCNRNGLGVIRALGEEKYKVIATHDAPFRYFGKYSRYVKSFHWIPPFSESEINFIDRLVEIANMEQVENEKIFLIPTGDMYVYICAKYWKKLQPFFKPIFDTNLQTLLDCGDKSKFVRLIKSLSLPIPKDYDLETLKKEPNLVEFPIIIKPTVRENSSVWRLKICQNLEELNEVVEEIENNFLDVEFVIQSFIPGGDDTLYTAGIYAHKGKLLACYTGKKVRQFPPITGEASLAVSLKEDKLIDYSKKIVKSLKYTGIAQIEFKKYEDNFYAIEMNPRSWSWISLSTASGVNLPAIACKAYDEKIEENCITNKKNNIYWSYFFEDLRHNFIQNKNIPLLNFLSLFLKKKVFAVFSLKDPLPFFIYLWVDVISRVFVKLLKLE